MCGNLVHNMSRQWFLAHCLRAKREETGGYHETAPDLEMPIGHCPTRQEGKGARGARCHRSADVTPFRQVQYVTGRLCKAAASDDVSLGATCGEIHRLPWENGARKSTIAACLCGFDDPEDGAILVSRIPAKRDAPADANSRSNGMVRRHFVPVDSIWVPEKTALDTHRDPPTGHAPCRTLSGGNVQTVVVACESEQASEVVLANQPSRGPDVGVIEYMHERFLNEWRSDHAILMTSEELGELLKVRDCVVVMFKGQVPCDFPGDFRSEEAGLEEAGLLMAGHASREIQKKAIRWH